MVREIIYSMNKILLTIVLFLLGCNSPSVDKKESRKYLFLKTIHFLKTNNKSGLEDIMKYQPDYLMEKYESDLKDAYRLLKDADTQLLTQENINTDDSSMFINNKYLDFYSIQIYNREHKLQGKIMVSFEKAEDQMIIDFFVIEEPKSEIILEVPPEYR